jgi:hypothetical protein
MEHSAHLSVKDVAAEKIANFLSLDGFYDILDVTTFEEDCLLIGQMKTERSSGE